MNTINIEIEEGVDYTLSLTYRDDTTNLPIDLTGYSAALQIKYPVGDLVTLLSLDSDNGISLGGINGTVDINITADQTLNRVYDWAFGFYDLILTEPAPSNKLIKLVKGMVTIIPGITQ